jgi:hypothetical protein
MFKRLFCATALVLTLSACDRSSPPANSNHTSTAPSVGVAQAVANPTTPSTCIGDYPSYFQDPAFTDTGMWNNQVVINQPTPNWAGPVFQLSDAYSTAVPESDYPWLKFNPFDASLTEEQKSEQAKQYLWAVMNYIQEGNIDSGDVAKDWTLCNNPVRQWFHIPYQTYEPLSGREFVHGLTREAPVTMTLEGDKDLKTTMWAVGFYNPAAGQSISTVWTGAPAPAIPQENFRFNEGSVIGKLLFTTANPNQYPFLTNVPIWQANISAPEYCSCEPSSGGSQCTFEEQTEQCPRTVSDVYLLQFDIAVRDERSPVGWAYGTFVADGQRKANEQNPWNRIAALGLMWGNDKPPVGVGAAHYPEDPHTGMKDGVVFGDVVDMLNEHTNAGHLGCNSRLNGPADNAQSSCLSCHQTASVPDKNNSTPAIMYQFGGFDNNNGQCMTNPDALDLEIDQVYFNSFLCSTSFTGPANVVPPPQYVSGQPEWISTDFSLQLSISLTQWQEWAEDQKNLDERVFEGTLPNRGGQE